MKKSLLIRKEDLFFYIALIVYLSMAMILDTAWFGIINFRPFEMICFFISVGSLILDNLFSRRFDNMPLYFGLLVVFLVVAVQAENIRYLVLMILFIISGRNMDLDKILKVSYFVIMFFVAFTVVFFYLGVFNGIEHSFYRQGSDIFRSSLGFSYTAYAPHYLLTLFMIYVYITRNKKHVLLQYCIFFLVGIWFYIETNTRTAFYVLILLFALALINRIFKIDVAKYKISRFMLKSTFFICSIVTFIVVLNYPNNISWISDLNRLLNYRIAYAYDGIMRYGISVFGNPVEFILSGSQYFYIDSSYVQLFLLYGPIVFLIILILYTLLMCRNVDEHNTFGIIVVGIIAIRGITDPQIINLAYSPFILSLGSSMAFYARKRKMNIVSKTGKRINSLGVIK